MLTFPLIFPKLGSFDSLQLTCKNVPSEARFVPMYFLELGDFIRGIELEERSESATAQVPFTVQLEQFDRINEFTLRFDRPEYVALSLLFFCFYFYFASFTFCFAVS